MRRVVILVPTLVGAGENSVDRGLADRFVKGVDGPVKMKVQFAVRDPRVRSDKQNVARLDSQSCEDATTLGVPRLGIAAAGRAVGQNGKQDTVSARDVPRDARGHEALVVLVRDDEEHSFATLPQTGRIVLSRV